MRSRRLGLRSRGVLLVLFESRKKRTISCERAA
jgi:hypothetical protein